MTDNMSERERFETNPLRLLRCGLELGKLGLVSVLQRVDEAQDVWDDGEA